MSSLKSGHVSPDLEGYSELADKIWWSGAIPRNGGGSWGETAQSLKVGARLEFLRRSKGPKWLERTREGEEVRKEIRRDSGEG